MNRELVGKIAGFTTALVTRLLLLAIWSLALQFVFNNTVADLFARHLTFFNAAGLLVLSEIVRG